MRRYVGRLYARPPAPLLGQTKRTGLCSWPLDLPRGGPLDGPGAASTSRMQRRMVPDWCHAWGLLGAGETSLYTECIMYATQEQRDLYVDERLLLGR